MPLTSNGSPTPQHHGDSALESPDVGLRRTLAAIGTALQQSPEADLLGILEQELRQRFLVRGIHLRELPAGNRVRLEAPTRTAESVAFAVPTREAMVHALLEVGFDAGRPPSPGTIAALAALAPVVGLILDSGRRGRSERSGLPGAPEQSSLIGSSPSMCALRDRIARVATTDFTVLIQGESGTGKELVARQIHDRSRRLRGPFVAVNCAAIVDTLLEAELFGIEERTATGVRGRKGKFEHADGGTLFLDEIGDLSLSAQAKLLRAIQELSIERVGATGTKRVNIRVLAATNRPLAEMVSSGLFRADLFYRLSGVEILVPPLRARRDDIRELAVHFLHRHRPAHTPVFAEAAFDALLLYAWPGNVRELERLIERALALVDSQQIELDDLPAQVRGEYAAVLAPALVAGDTMRAWGSRYARLVFERCGGNKRRTCKLLDISYHTLKAYLRYARPQHGESAVKLPAWVHSVSADYPGRPDQPS